MKNQALRKMLREQLADLQKQYGETLHSKTPTKVGEWLSDNYYILARESAAVLKNLRHAGALPQAQDGLPTLFHECSACCEGGALPDTQTLASLFSQRELCAQESQSMELMLRAALLHAAWEACTQNGGNAKMLGDSIQALRNLQEIDFEELLARTSKLERLFLQDPAGVYPQMDEHSRAHYRRHAQRRAEQLGVSETEFAQQILQNARENNVHIGTLFETRENHAKRGGLFLALELLLPVLLSLLLGVLLRKWYLPLLTVLPLWEALRGSVERFSLRTVEPCYLPRMQPDSELAQRANTLITVSMLVPEPQEAHKLKKRMLELYRSNAQPNIGICCLLDFKAANTPEKPEDRAAIAAVRRVVGDLNQQYGGSFFLAVRPRVFSPTQGSYSGLERKRGAITELVRAIRTEQSAFLVLDGDRQFLRSTQYLLALDADTLLPMDTAAELLAVAVHPLNRAVIDTAAGRVTAGYGILVPRIENELFGEDATRFTRLLAGDGGITVYDSFASERYQDLFGDGIFSGKGLIDVAAFHALLENAFPPEQVLSHDILEGGFLRVGFVSDLQAADGFPRKQGSYFARLNRWVRGDWQNLPFIYEKGPLTRLTRYKLLDNLRRSLTPVFSCLGLLLSLLLPRGAAWAVILCALLATAGPGFLSFLRTLAAGGPGMLSRLYYSDVIPSALSALLRAALAVVMLPQTAYTCADALLRALYRLFFSRKKLLEWTTAAQSEQEGMRVKTLLQFWPSLLTGGLLVAFGSPLQRLVGLFFLADIPFALLSARVKRIGKQALSYRQRDRLQSYAAAMWRYYEEQCTKENNFLPPDNVQETPVYTVAQRTSPTNIGLALLCCLAARDLGFLCSADLYKRLDESLCSIEKLEKWNGNLLNWYDTVTLRPLHPRYVSTVDSGNFLCSLVTLRQGISEYFGEEPRLKELAARVQALSVASDLRPLYHERRRLFHIGIDLETGELSRSFYDLLMSEARMTGYYAVASRAVPKKHWGAMGRMLVRDGRYTGPVSWTGTMFEYFMPYLFLPAPRGSLSYEGLEFCLWCQRKRVRQHGIPWGISESGFFAFDRQLNYQYKAHGVQKLGLKRGLDSELVISPYSSFLALTIAPHAALRNLSQLEHMELTGRCGFYEAADFTPARTGGQDYTVVRSYMAHHVGMSLLAVLNTLQSGVVQKRFLSDDCMAAASSLLLEKIPSGAVVFADVDLREVPVTREHIEAPMREYGEVSNACAHVKLLTNGEWTSVLSDTGAGFSLYRGSNVTRHSRDLLQHPIGIFALFRYGNRVLPAVKALGTADGTQFSAAFTDNEVNFRAGNDALRLLTRAQVHPRMPCEQRQYSLKNNTASEMKGDFLVYLEPSLISGATENEHPAFFKLFLLDSYDAANRLLLFTRRPREQGQTLCMALGFLEAIPFSWETARDKLLQAGDGIFSLLQADTNLQGGRGNPDACAALCVRMQLPPKSSRKLTLLLACASTREEAVERLLRVREQGGIQPNKGALCPFAGGGVEAVISETVLPALFYAGNPSQESGAAVAANTLRGRDPLWSLGISGDYPVIYAAVEAPEEAGRVLPYILLNKRLRVCCILTDLVIAYREGSEYDTPILSALRELIKKENCEMNVGTAGGIHLVNIGQRSEQEENALKARATFIAPKTAERFHKTERNYEPLPLLDAAPVPEYSRAKRGISVKGGTFTGKGFLVNKSEKQACVPWSFILSNPSFGTMAGDKALGFSWAINARENKLTPWQNDPCADNRGERLLLKVQGKLYDLIHGAGACFAPDEICYEGEVAGLRYKVSLCVPEKGMAKFIHLSLENRTVKKQQYTLAYYTEPVLGVNREGAAALRLECANGGVLANHASGNFKGWSFLTVSGGADSVCRDRADFFMGNWSGQEQGYHGDPCAAVCKVVELDGDAKTELHFTLAFAMNRRAALLMPEKAGFHLEASPAPSLQIQTPNEALNQMVNRFLPAQILSSRFQGRTGFYQCGGAWGFRDQLQDVMAFLYTRPQLVRRHLLRCCAVQFEQGDVLHWWHRLPKSAGGLRGVRTKCSDDLLWLPLFCAQYVNATGDFEFLKTNAPFLQGEELGENEGERYFQPQRSGHSASVYEHCIRAIEHAARFGEHGLPLMGVGDWNDGFSRIGAAGKGESVWMAQFYSMVLTAFAPLCERMEDLQRVAEYRRLAVLMHTTVDDVCWDGDHYLRAFCDDGTPVGKTGAAECAIDSLTQSFAVLCDMPSAQRRHQALDSAVKALVDKQNGIVKLFTPPFTPDGIRPGYVAAYPAGIRENGGQYTHAAVWLAIALLRENRREEGYALLRMLNPADFCADEACAARYRAEPYALAGDVSASQGIEGRAGWSLYTGSAAWFYRAVVEDLLGIGMQDGQLTLSPRLPQSWENCTACLTTPQGKQLLDISACGKGEEGRHAKPQKLTARE